MQMQLIRTSTLKLEEFFDSRTPEYVILSHTWGRNEISFQEFQNGALNDKILNCCKQAQKDGFQYAWVDTCCIDKTSSSELSEAINSMYRWYQHSSICYTFLEDYSEPFPKRNWWARAEPDTETLIQQLRPCRWYTRGWTLQEIIAPSCVQFYDTHWTYLGTRMTLQRAISSIARIPLPVLNADRTPQEYNVAVRMSWASKRQTTRLEDEAYCLMGLFDVNMPMLYGEGRRAFQRLQEEILKRHEDYSLFVWIPKRWRPIPPFLATASSDFDEDHLEGYRFEELASLTGKEFGDSDDIIVQPALSIRSRGLSIKLPFLAWRTQQSGWAAICSLKREPLTLFCLPVLLSDASSHYYTRWNINTRAYIIPHDSSSTGFLVSSDNVSKFVYTNMTLATSAPPRPSAPTAFNLEVIMPSEANTRFCSLKLMKIYGSLVDDFRACATYESPGRSDLLFRYARNNHIIVTGAFIVGLRNGTPWCNILSHILQADFYYRHDSRSGMMETLKKSTDRAGTPAMASDFCRMQIGASKYNAYLLARVIKFGSGSDALCPRLVLEIAVHFPGYGSYYDEVGVLDCDFQLYDGGSIVKKIGDNDIRIESGEEPPYWRKWEQMQRYSLISADSVRN